MRLPRKFFRQLAAVPAALLPVQDYAHVEDGSLGALDGFLHPIRGQDHLLAMLGVGIVGARISGCSALHGHAHVPEAPKTVSPISYSFRFVISTSLVHLVGVSVGFMATETIRIRHAAACLGCLAPCAGVCFLTALY